MSSKKVKVSTKTRDKILDTAMRLFAEKGFSGTTTKKIAKEADINEALIFRYFSTKKALYGAIIERKISEEPRIEFPLEAFKETRDDWLIFKSFAIRILEKAERDPKFIRLLYFSALEGHELSDMFFDTYVENLNILLSNYIKQRTSEGAFKGVDPLLAAQAFIGMVAHYIIAQELFGEKKRRRIKKEKIVETFVKVFLDGIKNI